MIFCDFSGWFQKSGSEICCSVLASWAFLPGASKIAPHSVGLLAERSVLSFQLFKCHDASSYQGVQFQYPAALAPVPSLRLADAVLLPRGLVDMPAIKIPRLIPIDKIPNGLAAKMLIFSRLIELRALGRRVANQHQRIETGELRKPGGQFFFGIFARCIERRRIRLPKTSHSEAIQLNRLSMEIVEAILLAKLCDVLLRFMIPRDHVHVLGSLLHHRTESLDAASPIAQIARREVVVDFRVHQSFERVPLAVYVGKNQKLHVI